MGRRSIIVSQYGESILTKRKISKKRKKRSSRKKMWFNNGGSPHRGMYKGIWCDSSWELAFIMWCLDHNKKVTRNSSGFPYTWYNKKHYYFPDFIIGDTFYEIKGVMDGKSKRKIATFQDKLIVLDAKEIKPYLDYAKSVYGEKYWNKYE